jgi:SAM-dependent methyltransferase
MKKEEIKKNVREAYAEKAKKENSCCPQSGFLAECISKAIGYTKEEIEAVPEGSNLGLGCGNPTALASIKEGETVLDLGSGAGFDCFLAAQKVGKDGKVIGVDMTPEMIGKARENAENGSFRNVEFRLGEIENLPVADQSIDLVISNCVINLSPDKKRVFQEAFRVLKPNGRIMISDLVLLKELPDFIKNSIEAYVECIGGAILKEEYLTAIKEAGFQDIKIVDETSYPADLIDFSGPTVKAVLEDLKISVEQAKEMVNQFVEVVSVKIYAIKYIQAHQDTGLRKTEPT